MRVQRCPATVIQFRILDKSSIQNRLVRMPADALIYSNSSARYSMNVRSKAFFSQQASLTLSKPVQASLYVSLCALILWTIYFTTYPPVHDRVHSLRHHTLLVGCH